MCCEHAFIVRRRRCADKHWTIFSAWTTKLRMTVTTVTQCAPSDPRCTSAVQQSVQQCVRVPCTEVMTDDCFHLVFARCLLGGRKGMSCKRHFAVIHKSSMSEQQEKKNEKRSNWRTQAYVKMAVKTLCEFRSQKCSSDKFLGPHYNYTVSQKNKTLNTCP